MGMLGDYVNGFLPEDPDKNAAARAGMLSFGAEMLKGRGNFGGILGNGLQAGAGGYQGALQQQQQAALHAEQQRRWKMENEQTQAKLDEPMQLAKIFAGDQAAPSGAPAPAQAPAATGPISGMPAAGGAPAPGPAPVQQMQQPQTRAPAAANPAQLFQTYMGYGDKLTHAGRPTQAKAYYDLAEKLRPKLKEQAARTVDGKRVLVNVMDDGTTQTVDGYAPDQEKLAFQNLGGSTVAVDPYTGLPVKTFQNTQSADSRATDARERQRMAFDQQKEQNAPKGQIIQTEDGPMLIDQRSGSGRVVTGPDGRPLTMMAKPLNDSQSKALLFGTRMQEADKVLRDLARSGTLSSVPGSRAPLVGGVINAFSGEDQQSLDQAKRDFLNATLRRESGAAIGPSEFENGDKQYFPQVGDSDKVIAQKARNRELATRGVLMEVPERHRNSLTPTDTLGATPNASVPVKISGAADYQKLPSGAEFIAPDGIKRRKP